MFAVLLSAVAVAKRAHPLETWANAQLSFGADGTISTDLKHSNKESHDLQMSWFPAGNSKSHPHGPKSYTTMEKNGKVAYVYSKKEMHGTAMPKAGDKVAVFVPTKMDDHDGDELSVKFQPVKATADSKSLERSAKKSKHHKKWAKEGVSFLEIETELETEKKERRGGFDWERVYQTFGDFGGGFKLFSKQKIEADLERYTSGDELALLELETESDSKDTLAIFPWGMYYSGNFFDASKGSDSTTAMATTGDDNAMTTWFKYVWNFWAWSIMIYWYWMWAYYMYQWWSKTFTAFGAKNQKATMSGFVQLSNETVAVKEVPKLLNSTNSSF